MTLSPDSRALLLDALRPPPGMALQVAAGTTFSLDLQALLLPPIAFAMFDGEESGDLARVDPVALLEAIRAHSERITVFCHAGRIALGPYRHDLVYAEQMIVSVRPHSPHHAFHPKVWVLRFAGGRATAHRLIVLSRNLTFDRSWDTVLTLEQAGPDLAHRALAPPAQVGTPVGDFLRGLPGLATMAMPTQRAAAVADLADSVSTATFALPEDVTDATFHVLGMDRRPATHWPLPQTADRAVVISPFLHPRTVTYLDQVVTGPSTLISRDDQLATLDPTQMAHLQDLRVLRPGLDPEPDEVLGDPNPADSPNAPDTNPSTRQQVPTGLHAKVFVFDTGPRATVLVGSANATQAAFAGNVEVLVSLSGRADRIGVDTVLTGRPESPAFGALTQTWYPEDVPAPQPDEPGAGAQVLDTLAGGPLNLAITPTRDGYTATLTFPPLTNPPAGLFTVRMLTVGHGLTTEFDPSSGTATLAEVTFRSLTPFLVLGAQMPGEPPAVAVVLARMTGAPADRRERMLAELLDSRGKVLRYLLYLLALGDPRSRLDLEALQSAFDDRPTGDPRATSGPVFPLYEALLRRLASDPTGLDRIDRLARDLAASGAADRLPEGWATIWDPIWSARERLR